MIDADLRKTIVTLHAKGMGIREIARRLHHDRNTVRAVLRAKGEVNLVPRKDAISIDALVLPSRENDPFGLVVAEAMIVGTPVIVTEQCGIAGYLSNDHDAVIVKAESVDALKTGIVKLMNVETRSSLGQRGGETAQRLFSLDRMIDAYETLLKK